MKETVDKPYMEKPFSVEQVTTEQMIYGGGDTLTELQEQSDEKKKQLLNESDT